MALESDASLRKRLLYVIGAPILASGEELELLATRYGLQRQTNATDESVPPNDCEEREDHWGDEATDPDFNFLSRRRDLIRSI